jgi:hypothetical protein
MRYLVATLFLTSLSFLSCKTYQIEKMSSLGESLTEEEMVALSQDCEYVKKNIKRGLKRLDGSIEDKKLKKAERKARESRDTCSRFKLGKGVQEMEKKEQESESEN